MRGKYAESTRYADAYSPRILRAFSAYSPRILRVFSAQSARAENARRMRGESAENARRMRVSPRDFPQAYIFEKSPRMRRERDVWVNMRAGEGWLAEERGWGGGGAFGWQYDRRENLPFDSSWLAHSFHPINIKHIWFSSWRTVGRYFRLFKFSEKTNKMRYCSRPSHLNFFTHSSFICQDFVTSFQSVDSFQRTLIANMFICEKKLKYQIWKRDFRCKLSLMRCWPRLWASSGAFAFFSVHQRELLSNADVVQSQLLRRKQKEKRILVAAFATVWFYHLACQVNLSG